MAYQKKLLKPSTKIQTPVNCTTPARSDLKDCISWGNIGARANGPIPWQNEVPVAIAIALIFQNRFQF